MTVLQAILLGIVQGITEFLPVSSTGHLVLVTWLFDWAFDRQATFIFDVLVQWGTLVAVIIYFRGDILSLLRSAFRSLKRGQLLVESDARLAWFILIASLPAAAAGILLKPLVEEALSNPSAVAAFLLFNAAFLFISEKFGKRTRTLDQIGLGDSIWIGFSQVLALFPGVSRSGVTIGGGLLRNLERRDAARFSFLMAIPIMLGAGFIALLDLIRAVDVVSQIVPLLAGFVAAAGVGYLAIHWLLRYLTRSSLFIFAIYCALVGLAGLILGVIYG